ncbi:MAG: hypothetical protein HOA08_08070 [Rhodospirillaceae bacterium]|jgi:hypothetical protein|nr:hypothetical protein [Rhodospirillaceae bacterium]MBT3493524.1 hypothetical protein [Rhodospirillaceae bacterium]MBT3779038.1 hypothetical protein [Rhodospirillaceae bacterium]MBT3976863.1 hypothetical protein [Rhodospirillaceae bacterium]MBT4168261.1 hypothetical protein [Rhodospirillaceae bacterium]
MNTTETSFTDAQTQSLRWVVDMIIPASTEDGLPSANDPVIFANILAAAQLRRDAVEAALSALDEVARESQGKDFAGLAPEGHLLTGAVETFRHAYPDEAGLLAMLTVQCYYRDDRVMSSLDMEARAPHPAGYDVDQGDWSLLEPVRGRPEFFRKTP